MNKLLLFLTLVLTISSCKQKRIDVPIEADLHFKPFISAYTSGIISKTSPIHVFLKHEIPDSILNDTNSLRKTIKTTPAFDYTIVNSTRNKLELVPLQNLDNKKRYKVDVNMEELLRLDLDHEVFSLVFETITQDYKIKQISLEPKNAYKPNNLELTGYIETTDVAKFEDVKQIITSVGKYRLEDLRFTKYNNKRFKFSLKNIVKQKEKTSFNLAFDGQPIDQPRKVNQRIDIPAKSDFSYSKWEYESYPDQLLTLYFTEPLNSKQELKGLVTLDQSNNMSFEVDGTKLKVYLNTSHTGQDKLVVHRGIQNFEGEKTKVLVEDTIYIDPPRPTIEIIGDGTILPNSQGLIVPFKTIGLKKVDVELYRIHENNVLQFLQVNEVDETYQLRRVANKLTHKTINLEKTNSGKLQQWTTQAINIRDLIRPQPGAIYRVRFSFKPSYTFNTCTDIDDVSTRNDFFDYYENSDFDELEDTDVCDRYFYYSSTKSKNLIASDLGLIVKQGNADNFTVIATNLVTGNPMPNTTIKFYNYAQQVIKQAVTNQFGIASVATTETPSVIVGSHNRHKSYIQLNRGLSNSTSKFATDGAMRSNGVEAFFYGERGVWRPGDSIYLSCVVKDEFNKIRHGQPANLKFIDPKGRVVSESQVKLNKRGILSFPLSTDIDAPTGYYQVVLSSGSYDFRKSLLVETVRPNRLKINLDLGAKEIETHKTKNLLLSSHWLHGKLASDLKAKVTMRLTPSHTTFPDFKNFIFENSTKRVSQSEQVIYDENLDSLGQANIELPQEKIQSAGKMKAQFITKVFEKGGGFSIDNFNAVYHPYTSYVGMKLSYNNYGYLSTSKPNKIEIVNVQPNGKVVKAKTKLRLQVFKIEWRWWWQHNESDLASYLNNNSYELHTDKTLEISGETSYNLTIPEHEWGQYFVQITNEENGHSCGKLFFADYYGSTRNAKDQSGAMLLSIESSKPRYKLGENAQVSFQSPGKGKALISIENDLNVEHTYWVDVRRGNNNINVPLTRAMTPSCYVHVTLLQPHVHLRNDKPIRLYGVIPLDVYDASTVLYPEVKIPEEIRPDENINVAVSEKNGKAMYYTIAIVDEGLLDLTRYKTPKIWKHFNKKRALGILTYDVYDQVINAFSGKFENVYRIGGDAEGVEGNIAKANRFKPTVKYLGPFYLKPGGRANHRIKIENYIGSVKTMIIARNGKAFGSSDAKTRVVKPLMIQTSAPRTLTPGDELEIPVNLFLTEEAKLPVTVSLKANNGVQVLTKKLVVRKAKNGEAIVKFKIKVGSQIGASTFKIEASCANDKHQEKLDIPIRLPGYAVSQTALLTLKPGQKGHFNIRNIGWQGTNSATLETSTYPSIDLEKRLNYLIRYPHGCIEQTTSSVFPQLYLSTIMDISEKRKEKIDKNINAAITRLAKFQTLDGGFSYWPGGNSSNEWGSSYAGHFLIEAKALGYYVPDHLLNAWYQYQTKQINASNSYAFYHKEDNQAYRLYTLAHYGKPDIGAMNRFKELKLTSNAAKWRIATAYALAGRLDVAKSMIKELSENVRSYRDHGRTYGSGFRDKVIILEAMLAVDDQRYIRVMKELANKMGSKSYLSTQETAYGLLAYSKLVKKRPSKNVSYVVTKITEEPVTYSFDSPIHQLKLGTPSKIKTVELQNTSDQPIFIKMINTGTPISSTLSDKSNGISLKVRYANQEGKTVKPTQIKYGQDYKMYITVTNKSKISNLQNIALSTFFASGCEIENTRLSGGSRNNATYEDIRDDRCFAYFDLRSGASKTFYYTFTSTYKGRFLNPGIHCEAMYDPSIYALRKGEYLDFK